MAKMIAILSLVIVTFVAGATDYEILRDSSGNRVRYGGNFSAAEVKIPKIYRPKKRNLRGVWVATVENLDFATHTSAAAFKSDYLKLLAVLKNRGFNAIFFQVRPNCDAFYPSRYNPYSRFLSGKEGRALDNFDPLKFMIIEAKKRGIEFHAWLNPYRVVGNTKLSKEAYLKTLAPQNFARRNPTLVLSVPAEKSGYNHLFLNPGEAKVREHLLLTVRELVVNYDIDSIHFDDYFYPYNGMPASLDAAVFRRNNPKNLNLADWRRRNIDLLIANVGKEVKRLSARKKKKVEFGVSPFGIWANRKNHKSGSLTGGKESYFNLYADSRGWIKNGYIDYIVPQIYWPFGHNIAAYGGLADWWSWTVRGTKVKLYIGVAAYQSGSSSQWAAGELFNQLRYNSGRPEISGEVWFRYGFIASPTNKTMQNEFNKIFSYWRNF